MERWTASTVYADMWVDPDDDPREQIGQVDGERGALLRYLGKYRLTLEMKCAGLSAEQLAARSVPPSTMSLLGMIRHLAEVERGWFRREMAGQDAPRLHSAPDGDWDDATGDPAAVEEAWAAWRAEAEFADAFVAATEDLGTRGVTGEPLREVLIHMIEEYARHCGHADLLRERIDGRTGQ
jgi:uncharacterized damage-inducible protein DinB